VAGRCVERTRNFHITRRVERAHCRCCFHFTNFENRF
jgi:hypothetical protein